MPAWDTRPSPSALTSTVCVVVCLHLPGVLLGLGMGFANRILKSQEDAPGGFLRSLLVDQGRSPYIALNTYVPLPRVWVCPFERLGLREG